MIKSYQDNYLVHDEFGNFIQNNQICTNQFNIPQNFNFGQQIQQQSNPIQPFQDTTGYINGGYFNSKNNNGMIMNETIGDNLIDLMKKPTRDHIRKSMKATARQSG